MTAAFFSWLGLVAGITNLACGALLWRERRRLNATLDHAMALDRLLAHICVEALAAHHLPVWKAWAAVMGNFTVEITTTRRAP